MMEAEEKNQKQLVEQNKAVNPTIFNRLKNFLKIE